MTIRRVNRGRSHSYVDTVTGEKIPGVTTITKGGLPKDSLIKWSADATINYAIDNWHELSRKPVSVRIAELSKARFNDRDTAANRGTQVHKLAQRLVAGERIAIPDGLEGHVQSYVRFLDEFDVVPILVEAVIVSRRHRYCGTLDLIGDLLDPEDPDPDRGERQRVRWLLDIKTSRSGVFGESVLQLAGYRHAEAYVDADGEEWDLPEVERTGVVHVRANGYELIPVEISEQQHRTFLYAKQIAQFDASYRELIGEPVVPPQTSTYRLERS